MTKILKRSFYSIFFLSLCIASNSIFAQDLTSQKVLSLELSTQAAMTAVKKCLDNGHKISIAIVDQSGLVKVQLKGDGAAPHTLDSSRRKAYTAVSLRDSTHKYATLVVQIEGEVVGGIGVGGAPGVEFDEACASAALKVLKADDTYDKK